MIILKYCVKLRGNLLNKCLLNHAPISSFNFRAQNYIGTPYKTNQQLINNQCGCQSLSPFLPLHRRWYSKSLHEDVKDSNEYKKIKELFPQPRSTLNNLTAKTPQKIFDVHFKQHVAPKIGKKKVQNLDWTCTYTFIWPEKMKFECTALSKRQAADKTAYQALYWLYTNNRIDSKGSPVYDKTVLSEIRSGLNEPILASIGDKSVERIERIWNDYEDGIKNVYEKTAQEAKNRIIKVSQVFMKDSTIDEEEISDVDSEINNKLGELDDVSDTTTPVHPVYGRVIKPPSEATLERRNKSLERIFEQYKETITPLPIDEYAAPITRTVCGGRVCVVVGAAGCGKSTRVPAAVVAELGASAAVLVAEPRRVAAIGLADRVAAELGEEVGETVGYQVRLDSKPPRPPAGSILYCTSGVLLNRLQANPGLTGCSHVIIDEAHERDVNTDVTMLLLKRALNLNPDLKIIIMSATLDTEVFTKYFNNAPLIEVPGRLHPVEVMHLDQIEKEFNIQLNVTRENCGREDGWPQICVNEIVKTIKAVDKKGKEGAILVFLPGWAEIKLAKQMLDEHYGESGLHMILPVHSRLSTTDQTKMFCQPPPGVRKIVLSTNVAETSVTIPDAVHVVDGGLQRENRLRGTGTSSLETVWVSLAAAKQRSGRAGRVQPGQCYRMYTKEKENEFEPHTTPEILRIPLEQTVLNCKSYAPEDKAQDFLSQLPQPPTNAAVKHAVNELIDIGALTPSERLTRLGHILSHLSLSPRVGVGLVNSCALGTTLPMANIAVHCDTNTELFGNAGDRREEIREIKRKYSSTSDHASLHWIQQDFEDKLAEKGWSNVNSWCQSYNIRKERLGFVKSLSSQYLTQIIKSGLIDTNLEMDDISRFNDIDEMSIATLLTGVNGLLVTRKCVQTKGKLKTANQVFTSVGDKAHIASESVNHALTKQTNRQTLLVHSGGTHSRERRALVVYKSSVVTPHVPLLFCKGNLVEKSVEEDPNTTILCLPRHKLEIHVPTNQAPAILKARKMLWSTLQYYIDRDIKNIEYDEVTTISRFKIRLLKAVAKMLVEETNKCNNITVDEVDS